MYRRGTSLPTAPLEAEQPPDAKRTDEGGERERTGIHQSADHNLDGDRHQERQRGAEKQGKRDDGQLRPSGNAFHGVGYHRGGQQSVWPRHPGEASVPRFTSRLMSAISPP